MLLNGEAGLARDPARAVRLFRAAAAAGHAPAHNGLGALHLRPGDILRGLGEAPNATNATDAPVAGGATAREPAGAVGGEVSGGAVGPHGGALGSGAGRAAGAGGVATAPGLLGERGAAQRRAEALALYAEVGGPAANYSAALAHFSRSGNADAHFHLGGLYRSGRTGLPLSPRGGAGGGGLDASPERFEWALAHYARAASLGHPRAALELAQVCARVCPSGQHHHRRTNDDRALRAASEFC